MRYIFPADKLGKVIPEYCSVHDTMPVASMTVDSVLAYINKGEKIDAIKYFREVYPFIPLVDAKNIVEHIISHCRVEYIWRLISWSSVLRLNVDLGYYKGTEREAYIAAENARKTCVVLKEFDLTSVGVVKVERP